MKKLKINHQLVEPVMIKDLTEMCPFSAITNEGGVLSIGAGCTMCGLCVKSGPAGVFSWVESDVGSGDEAGNGGGDGSRYVDISAWFGIAVYAEQQYRSLHGVVGELLGKARQLAGNQPVYALLIGSGMSEVAKRLLLYGADRVYVYDHPGLAGFDMEPYANIFSDFINKVKPSSVMVGATSIGRSMAPRVAARFRTGLTADCTALEIRDNNDLIQIRPAFGGNIMARIITPKHRPQFCTVRYKVFSAPDPVEKPTGFIEWMPVDATFLKSSIQILSVEKKPPEIDLSEAKVVVAIGRGIKKREDIKLAEELASFVGAQVACSRPLAENGWFNSKRQIGLSGRTVNADLIITLGISGSVQFAAGMRGSQCIIAVNNDENAAIFDIAHYGFVGDLYDVVPALIKNLG